VLHVAFSFLRVSVSGTWAWLALLGTSAAHGKLCSGLCVYDPVGSQGEAFNMMKDFKLTAAKWGANLELKALYG
jgi:hypothetical protein